MALCEFCERTLEKALVKGEPCPHCGFEATGNNSGIIAPAIPSSYVSSPPPEVEEEVDEEEREFTVKDVLRTITGRGPKEEPNRTHTLYLGNAQGFIPSDSVPLPPKVAPTTSSTPDTWGASSASSSPAPPPAAPASEPVEEPPRELPPPTKPREKTPDQPTVRTLDVPDETGSSANLPSVNPARSNTPSDAWKSAIPSAPSNPSEQAMVNAWGKSLTAPITPLSTIKASPAEGEDEVSNLLLRTYRVQMPGEALYERAEYQVIEVIGEGGVGIVYAAMQASVSRTVALKMLREEYARRSDHRNKFLTEAVVTGELDHPNIVPIYDLGTTADGTLFYAMKRVRGIPWSNVIREKPLADNLKILMSVADAIAFAHDRQVVHRDLKPENVMLGDFGEVLVMDWGIALSTSMYIEGAGRISQTSSMGGTPAYMAPEMATGPIELIGPPSDVYLLGAILFEIVSGKPPHNGKDVMACLFAAARNEIQETDKSGELLDIAMQAMSTDIKARPGSVKELQKAIQQYLSHSESIVLSNRADEELTHASRTRDYQDYARAMFAFQESKELWPGNSRAVAGELDARLAYAQCALDKGDFDLGVSLLDPRDPKQAPLHRKLQLAQSERAFRQKRFDGLRRVAGLLILILLVGFTGAFFWIREQSLRTADANKNLKSALDTLNKQAGDIAKQNNVLETQKGELESQRGELEKKRDSLQLEKERADNEARLARESQQREALASYLAQIGVSAERVANNSFLDADRLLAQYEQSSTSYFRHWEWSHLRYLCGLDVTTLPSDGRVEGLARSEQGNLLAACTSAGEIKIWTADWATNKFADLQSISTGDSVAGIALSRDGSLLAAAIDSPRGIVRIYRRQASGQFSPTQDFTIHRAGVLSVEISPDGTKLASSSRDETARVTNLATGEMIAAFRGHFGPVWSVRFDSSGNELVTAGDDATVRMWTLGGPPKPRVFRGHKEAVYNATFSSDGKLVASAGRDKEILVWQPADVRVFDYKLVERQLELERLGRPIPENALGDIAVQRLVGHTAEVRTLHFSLDGKKLLSGGHDNTARVWDLTAKPDDPTFVRTMRGHGGWVRSCLFSADEQFAISGSHDQRVKVWNTPEYEEVRTLRQHDNAVLWAAFSTVGDRCITAGRDRRAILWNLGTGQPLATLNNDPLEISGPTGEQKNATELKEGHEFLVTSALFMPAGDRRIITSAGDNTVRLWDIATGGQLHRFDGTGTISVIALSDDGKWLVTGSDTKDALLWSLADLSKPAVRLAAHRFEVSTATFSHDSETGDLRICTGDSGGVCHLWRRDPSTGNWKTYSRIATHEPGYGITGVAFTRDGGRLLTASQDHTVMQWDLATGNRLGNLTLRHPDGVRNLLLTADSKRAITMCSSGDDSYRLYSWDIDTAKAIECDINIPGSTATGLSLLPSQSTALLTTTTGDTSVLWTWDMASPQVQPLWSGKSLRGTIWSAISSHDGASILAVGGSQGRLLSAETGELEKTFSPHGAITAANFSSDGKLAVTASSDGDAKIWCTDEASDKFGIVLLKMSRLHEVGGRAFAVNFAAFAPSSRGEALLLTCGDDNNAKLWKINTSSDVPTYELAGVLEGHRGRVHSGVFSSDGKWVITASEDRTARLWSVDSLATISGGILEHPADVLFAAFSPDDSRVITGCDDNIARVFKIDPSAMTAVELTDTLSGHTAAVTSVAISSDNRRAVTGSKDGIAKLWCLETSKEVLSLKRHEAEITSVHFSPDGRDILTSSTDETALVWRSVNIAPSIRMAAEMKTAKPGMLQTLDHLADIRDPDSPQLGGGMLSIELAESSSSGTLSLVLAPPTNSGLVIEGTSVLYAAPGSSPVKVAEMKSGQAATEPVSADETLAVEAVGTLASGDALVFTFTRDATVEIAEKILRSVALDIGPGYQGATAEVRVNMTDNLGATSSPVIMKIAPAESSAELTAVRESAMAR